MKKPKLYVIFAIVIAIFSLSGCSESEDLIEDSTIEKLYVKFINSTDSEFTITTIELRARGKAGEITLPTEAWSSDILEANQSIAPGEFLFFNLEIPNLHYSDYRLGIDDGNGNEIFLHEQNNQTDGFPTITHWGGDERTVSVTVKYDAGSGFYYIQGWSDFSGI